ncbi:MAG: CotH kinase family protein [Melioribacteraceae bacterium]
MNSFFFYYTYIFLFLLFLNITFSQNVVINEIMSSNYENNFDEDGEASDWIELYNNSSQTIDLTNFYLSDSKKKLNKWQFPKLTILPDKHILVFASKKNKTGWASNWITTINNGDVWKYKVWGFEPSDNWKSIEFDDVEWLQGPSGIGFGDDDDRTVISGGVISVYLRKEFTIDDLNNISMLLFHIDYDDGFVAYINGQEIARENLGIKNEFVPYDMLANEAKEASIYLGGKPNKFVIPNIKNLLVEGTNVLSIQVHNSDVSSSDLSAIPILTIGYNNYTEENIPELIKNSLENLHTNFKISSSGETIYLSDAQLNIIDEFKVDELNTDISFGRKPDGAEELFFFLEPTPNKPNTTDGFKEHTEVPIFSLQENLYSTNQSLTFLNNDPQLNIYYTTTGEEPTISSSLYSEAIEINKTTVIKVKSFKNNFLPSNTITHTFLIDEKISLPTISLSTEPNNFFDADSGIYVLGRDPGLDYPYFAANFWKDWERPVHVEFIDENGNLQISQDAGAKIYGNWSRANEQKSLTLHARKRYSSKDFNFNFFPENDLFKYESLVLRNSGNDWRRTMLRDGMIQSLADDIGIDRLAFRPSTLYINGEYWGIHNLREKINTSYIADHHGIKKSEIDLIEAKGIVISGDNFFYNKFTDFIESHDFDSDVNYDSVKSFIDIDNFISYNVVEIYIANTDWPSNNSKFWRPKTSTGKFRWILYDTDFGFNFTGKNSYNHNTLDFALETDGPSWPNPSWATLTLRKLTENENFRNSFINRFADFSNTIFDADEVKSKIEKFKNNIEPEIDRHIERWNTFGYNKWLSNIDILNEFAEKRIGYLRAYFASRFNLEGTGRITINNNQREAGKVKLNSIKINEFPWSGQYFKGVPIKLQAIPNPGYRFIGWSGDVESSDEIIEYSINDFNAISARFEKINGFASVVINEINYQSHPKFNTGDWIEIYNNSEESINISNWVLLNELGIEIFKLEENTVLEGKAYLVLSENIDLFQTKYKDVNHKLGNFNIELKNTGDLIQIYNSENTLIDSVRYDNTDPWSSSAAGNGKTLELRNPNLDNSSSANWKVSSTTGTPGKQNDSFTVGVKKEKDSLPTQFKLEQNYPNPFNPTTTISYSTPNVADASFTSTTNVELKIYDVLGKEIKTLINKVLSPGNYSIKFDASSLSSGVYYYQIKVGKFIKTKKMILLK